MKDKKKSNVFKHFILTRFNQGIYDREDSTKWMTSRIKLFEVTKESVLSQDGEFKWLLSFDKRTPASVIDKICTDDRMIATSEDVREYIFDVDTEFIITSRLDNDDIYLKGAVLAIQESFQPQVYVIDMDYIQTKGDEKYTSGNKSKGEKIRTRNNGPFLSLCEPADYIRTCYCRPHNLLLDGYPDQNGDKIKIPSKKIEVYAEMVIHSKNMANKVTGYKI